MVTLGPYMADRILAINPGAEIVRCKGPWQEFSHELRDATAVFGCVDNYSDRAQLETMCRRFLLPYIDIGMEVTELGSGGFAISGQVIVSMPGHACMRCLGFLTDAPQVEHPPSRGIPIWWTA